MGKLSKEGVLALTAAAGAKVAPSVMPKVTAQAEQFFTSTIKGAREAMRQTSSELGEAILATPEGVVIKTPSTAKTPIETINDPKKIVTVDSNGNPSGTRFRDDYIDHISKRDFSVPRKKGIGGAHNLDEFNKYLSEIQINSRTPHPTVRGIEKIEYQIPALDSAGIPTGAWRPNPPLKKTVYDPAIISDEQMMVWGRQAFAEAQAANRVNVAKREWTGYAPNGLKFYGYIDAQNGAVRTFFPEF